MGEETDINYYFVAFLLGLGLFLGMLAILTLRQRNSYRAAVRPEMGLRSRRQGHRQRWVKS